MKIVVIGGTGLIGSKVVEKLRQKGHQVLPAAPSTGVNTITGEGLVEALEGAGVVVDVANSPSFEDLAAMEFFQTAGKNITATEVGAGVKHHIALSVVGTDRLQDSGYFRAKLAQETLIKNSPIPYTIVHATQFFEFIRTIAQISTKGDPVRLPHTLFQPMAAEDVATAVVEAALAAPLNGTVETAGPEFHSLSTSSSARSSLMTRTREKWSWIQTRSTTASRWTTSRSALAQIRVSAGPNLTGGSPTSRRRKGNRADGHVNYLFAIHPSASCNRL